MKNEDYLQGLRRSRYTFPGMYKWWIVGMLWFVCFFNYADRQAIFSVFPLLKSEMGLSDIQLGIVGASFMWVYALAGPLAGIIGDRLRRKTVILAGLIFWSLITIATAVSTQYWHLVLFRALEGLGEAFYFPASMALISDYHGPNTRSRALSLHQSSVYAGTVAGSAVGGLMGQYYGWRSGFYLFGSLGVLLGLVLLPLLREIRRGESEGLAPAVEERGVGVSTALAEIFRTRMVLVLITVFVGANFVAMIFLTWLPSFLFRKFGMSLAMAGFSGAAYFQMASVLGVLCGGVLADRWRKRHPGGRMLSQAIGLLIGVPFIFLTGWTLSVPVLIMAMAGFGFFKGCYDANIWASLHDVVRPRLRATAVGFMNSIGWLGGGLAPIAIAAASQRFGMSACLSASSAIYLVLAFTMVWGVWRFVPESSSGLSQIVPVEETPLER